MRRQLPVSSPVSLPALLRGLRSTLSPDDVSAAALGDELQRRFSAPGVVLCDSGTSALVLALQAAVRPGGSVAFPSYGCVDLAAAARHAGVRVRLYDVEPTTLSADLDSLRCALHRGVDAVVAVHLYGVPTDIPAVHRLAREFGVAVIEDAAQRAGATLNGRSLGSLGHLAVLSFGRGKGTNGGGGGALVATTAEWAARLETYTAALTPPAAGWRNLTIASAQWCLGRPAIYAVPSAVPWLRLGEMVYHPAHEPRSISRASAALAGCALRREAEEAAIRRRNAAALAEAARDADGITTIEPIEGAVAGYLRYPVLDAGARVPAPALGILRGYPRALFEQEELRPCLHEDEREPSGGRVLRTSLFTLPVHGMTNARDRAEAIHWIQRRR